MILLTGTENRYLAALETCPHRGKKYKKRHPKIQIRIVIIFFSLILQPYLRLLLQQLIDLHLARRVKTMLGAQYALLPPTIRETGGGFYFCLVEIQHWMHILHNLSLCFFQMKQHQNMEKAKLGTRKQSAEPDNDGE